ncbi:hypothetical protein R5R35_002028 [Gryllus longicercus]|uniref:Uncharacterized protein n=1 Tax=Gryllus longicercus TaxID=2509291 RepID=A0AAN9V8Q8_9ORTH
MPPPSAVSVPDLGKVAASWTLPSSFFPPHRIFQVIIGAVRVLWRADSRGSVGAGAEAAVRLASPPFASTVVKCFQIPSHRILDSVTSDLSTERDQQSRSVGAKMGLVSLYLMSTAPLRSPRFRVMSRYSEETPW